jgi:Ni,Fe-hydrogenase III small subunit/NAD-dependent dihydropyrimidine dehydrogenase PreA subunit
LDLLILRLHHGYQAIKDISNAKLSDAHRGFPVIDESKCIDNCRECESICPTGAIKIKPLSVDIGKCIFCSECESFCTNGTIKFINEYKLGSAERNKLIIPSGKSFANYHSEAIKARKEIHKLFGHSLKLRQVSSAGCNGCEMELSACGNVNFDMGRFGIDFVASPRHADGIVITGPISKNMAVALEDAYNSVNHPKLVIAVGACAISGGIFTESSELNREFLEKVKIDLYIPGCPPHPLNVINSIIDFIGKK